MRIIQVSHPTPNGGDGQGLHEVEVLDPSHREDVGQVVRRGSVGSHDAALELADKWAAELGVSRLSDVGFCD